MQLKNGSLPYEDEKFCYMAFSKSQNINNKIINRILRHPIINKGNINLEVCTTLGVKNITLSKKDGKIYKEARKLNAGDNIL